MKKKMFQPTIKKCLMYSSQPIKIAPIQSICFPALKILYFFPCLQEIQNIHVIFKTYLDYKNTYTCIIYNFDSKCLETQTALSLLPGI